MRERCEIKNRRKMPTKKDEMIWKKAEANDVNERKRETEG